MKTYGHLYQQVYDFEQLYDSYRKAASKARESEDVLRFTYNLEENLIQLQNELIWKTLEPRPVREFFVHDPKKRLIAAPDFRDRIVHWQIYKTIYPIFAKGYIGDVYGSIEGGGTQKAIARLMYWMRLARAKYGKFYVLKMDISKFFFRIPHAVAMEALSEKIVDPDMLWLFDKYINQPYAHGIPADAVDIEHCEREYDVGFAPGSLFTQTVANIVLDPIDQFVKRELRQHCYERFMDDMDIISPDKSELQYVKEAVGERLAEKGLVLNRKTQIVPGNEGVEALGYIVTPDSVRLRRKTLLRMERSLRHNKADYEAGKITQAKAYSVYESYLGLLKIVTGTKLRDRIQELYSVPLPSREWEPPAIEDIY